MPNDPYDELATPLGHFLIAFNGLEVALAGALMRILHQNDELVGHAFVAILGFRQKFELLKALAPLVSHDGAREKLLELLEDANTINEARNRFVHSDYSPVFGDDGDTLVFLHQRLKDFLRTPRTLSATELFKQYRPANPEELLDLANDASVLSDQLLRVSERFFPEAKS